MSDFFEISKTNEALLTFNYFDKDGSQILLGDQFTDKTALEKAIADVRVGSLVSDQIAAGKRPQGDYFFVIKDRSGNILVKSVLFDNQTQLDIALHGVKDNVCVAEIKDLTVA